MSTTYCVWIHHTHIWMSVTSLPVFMMTLGRTLRALWIGCFFSCHPRSSSVYNMSPGTHNNSGSSLSGLGCPEGRSEPHKLHPRDDHTPCLLSTLMRWWSSKEIPRWSPKIMKSAKRNPVDNQAPLPHHDTSWLSLFSLPVKELKDRKILKCNKYQQKNLTYHRQN